MAHFFVIYGITTENEELVMSGMLGISGTRQMLSLGSIHLYASFSTEDHAQIDYQASKALEGTGAVFFSGWLQPIT